MKKLAVIAAFLALVVFVSVPIFKLQSEISALDKQNDQLLSDIKETGDRIENASEKLDRLENGDEELLREYAREKGYYDSREELIYNDVLD